MKMGRLLRAAFEIPRFASPVAFSTYTAVRRLRRREVLNGTERTSKYCRR